MDKDYEFKVDMNKPFEEQNKRFLKRTKQILDIEKGVFYYEY